MSGMGGEWYSLGGQYLGQPGVVSLEHGEAGVSVELSVPGFFIEEAEGYTRVRLQDHDWDTDLPPGSPELPLIPVTIGVPAGMEAVLAAVSVDWAPVGRFRIFPVQPLETDGCRGQWGGGFVHLSDALAGDQPSAPAVLTEGGCLFGLDVVGLKLNPFRWNPETGLLEAASSITAEISFTGAPAVQTPVRPETAVILSSLVLNFGQMAVPVDGSPVRQDEAVYIVITIEENLPEITPLVEMVNLLGHRVVIELLPVNSTPQAIKSVIVSHFQPGTTRFALIAATHQQLPSYNYGSFYGDYYYQTIDGDNLPDIAVGRLPAGAGNLENMVMKAMAYSNFSGTPGEPSIPATTMLCAHEEDYPYKYTGNKNAIRDWNYTIMNPVFDTYYPPEGATQQQVKDRINAGVGTVNYRGHGSVTTWQWSPGWNAGAIYALENTFFPPVFNVACDNGAHDKVYNCLCESWLFALGRGASGTCGASAPSATVANHRFDRVIYWQLYSVGNTCAAEVIAAAQADIVQTQGAAGLSNARMYHWFGDPSMDIFNCDEPGSPFPLELTAPSHVFIGENSVTFTVSSQGTPVQGAVVTVTDGIGNHPGHPETFYVQEYTDAAGQAVLNFSVQPGSTVNAGARLHNTTPAFAAMQTWPQGVQGSAPAAFTLLPAAPNPASGFAGLGFDLSSPAVCNLLVMDLSGRIVDIVADGAFQAGQHRFRYSTADLVPGLYFVVLRGEGLSASTRMVVLGR